MVPPIRLRSAQIARLFLSSCALTALLVAQPTLKITSPADGTTVHPGESLTVTVDVSPPRGFQTVSVIGFHPIGSSKEALNAPPYRFTIEIPGRITPGTYALTAVGFTSPGHLINSDPIDVLVERTDSPVSISVYPPVADFTMNEKRFLQVTGLYADRTTADLTQSPRIRFVSSAPEVATVQAQGILTPVAPGTGHITITYGGLKLEVPVKVRRAVHDD